MLGERFIQLCLCSAQHSAWLQMNGVSEESPGPQPCRAWPFMAFSVWPHLFLCPVFSLIPFKALAWESELIFMIALNIWGCWHANTRTHAKGGRGILQLSGSCPNTRNAPEAGEVLRRCQLGSNQCTFLPGPWSQEFGQDNRKRGPGEVLEFLETEKRHQRR